MNEFLRNIPEPGSVEISPAAHLPESTGTLVLDAIGDLSKTWAIAVGEGDVARSGPLSHTLAALITFASTWVEPAQINAWRDNQVVTLTATIAARFSTEKNGEHA